MVAGHDIQRWHGMLVVRTAHPPWSLVRGVHPTVGVLVPFATRIGPRAVTVLAI